MVLALAPGAPTLHLIHSIKWAMPPGMEEGMKELPEETRKWAKEKLVHSPHCCELTSLAFCRLLAQAARAQGFNVVRWPVNGREDWLAIGEAARSGLMGPGPAAVMMHSWVKDYDKECVPAWEYYPVLEAVKARHTLLYPHAELDRLHSEKRYWSSLMPPTQFLNFSRKPGSRNCWQVEGRRSKNFEEAVAEAIENLRKDIAASGLPFKDVMVKQGLSWGGDDVSRVAPGSIHRHLTQKILSRVAAPVDKLTVLLQAKVDLVAELRWGILHGKLRGRGWRTFEHAARGQPIKTGGVLGEVESREALIREGLAKDEEGILQLEESFREKVEQVLSEATADAGGEVPQFLRVDLLVDKQGRAWLGERESWGADLVQSTLNTKTGCFSRRDPSKAEVAAAIASRGLRCCKSMSKPSTKQPPAARKQPHPKAAATGRCSRANKKAAATTSLMKRTIKKRK